jgi:uncharacterized ion transporter superfamily protein YfcC
MIKKIPDTLILILGILLCFVILTWIIPAGSFNRISVDGREVIDPDTYHFVPSNPQGLFDFLKAPTLGFISAGQIIAFVFLVGGAFSIVSKTGAIDAGLQSIMRFTLNHPGYKKVMLSVLTVSFSLAGATFGMSEEVLVFILITIPLAHSLGYDSLVGIFVPFIGAGAGFAGAFSNPFTIGIAQGIAELPPFSGAAYRLVVWVLFTSVTVAFLWKYVSKLEKNQKLSPLYSQEIPATGNNMESLVLTTRRKIVLLSFLASLILLIIGVSQWGWYINEISGLFFGLGVITALLAGLSGAEASKAFVSGAKDMMTAALVIAFSRGILIIAEDGKIIDTVLLHLSGLVDGFHKVAAIEMMFGVQTLINFFIPSGSGQAALTMPIMAPLSDLLGITRQTAVLAFQLGDGLSNMIIPTSGVTMGVLSIAKIPYITWLRWIGQLMIIFFLLAIFVLIPPVLFGWGPF